MSLVVNGGLVVASLALAAPAAATLPSWFATMATASAEALQADLAPKARSTPSRSGNASRQTASRSPASRSPASRPQARGGAVNNVNHSSRDVNRNVNRNTNRNVNVNVHGDYDHHGYYHDDWDDWDDHWHPAATIATAAVTAAVVGSIVNSVPPSCSTVVVNGVSYSQCGSTWYQPQYMGSSVQYVVVNPPR